MAKRIFQRLTLLLVLVLQACFTARDYERPEEAIPEEAFSQEETPALAKMGWRELFTDSILKMHIDTALVHNNDLAIALEQIRSAEAYFKQGKAGYYPSLNANANLNYQELSANSQFGNFFTTVQQYELSSTLSWEADIWGKIRSQKRAAEADFQASGAQRQAIQTRLIAELANAYFDLLVLDEQIAIARETLENRRQSVETSRALKDAGQLNSVQVRQSKAQLHQAEALLVELQRDRQVLEHSFCLLQGKRPQEVPRSSLGQQSMPAAMNSGISLELLQRRPDLRQAEWELVQAFEMSNVARSNFYPSLEITATTGFQSLDFYNVISPQSLFLNVLSGITQPIFNQRQIRTEYEAAEASQRQSIARFRQMILRASSEVSDAMSNWKAADTLSTIRQQEYDAYSQASEDAEMLLRQGSINYLDVLSLRENELDSRLRMVGNKGMRLRAITDLYRALGGGAGPDQ